ncbi:hypothetical protein VKA52_18795 [Halobacillus sp. HZG1]|uniref:hypothetical protein n=1 Tax=Halobacillus sp. HZG1 TaxID=3111769 RepID=UPI002DBDDDB8|nr:hypothetical protein [Halobacillus sp. HZG1]MEC3885775.1 hypothetical protein [Halobacillus sp. HZG1]
MTEAFHFWEERKCDEMGISVILLGFFIVVGFLMVLGPLHIVKKQGRGPLPFKSSLVIGSLLLTHWVLWLKGFYGWLPVRVADMLFLPVWVVLCGFGVILSGLEMKNNAAFAIPLAGFTLVSLIFALFLDGISQM